MAAVRLTLQNRVTSLMIISSVLLISAFIFIQLNNQLENLTRYNSYQANLASMIVKNSFETILKEHAPEEDVSGYLQASLSAMLESKLINEAVVFDKEGKIVSGTDAGLIGGNVRYKELGKWQDLEYAAGENKWSVTEIDRLRGRLDIYIGPRSNAQAPLTYLAKVSFSSGNIGEAMAEVYRPAILAAILIILANILLVYLLSKTVIGPIQVLNKVTKIIAEGNLQVRAEIKTNDELQELGETFNYMAAELVKMKERAENANPLTKLPGNIVIREEVDKRIKENRKFVVIYCDLDNFKAFNDKYGIAKGDEAIKLTAGVFNDAVKTKGDADDFIGHEGGDDFILLTTPEKAQVVADFIVKEFDQRVRGLYSQEDLTQGFIAARARDGSVKQFPVMAISLAGVTNEQKQIASYAEITNIAAELKKKAKEIEGSVFITDKRSVEQKRGS